MKSLRKLSSLAFLAFLATPSFAQEWQSQAEDVLPSGYGVFGISVLDENTVWASCFDFSDGQPLPDHVPYVMKTTNGGQTWTAHEVTEATGRWTFDIVGIDENTAWISTLDLGAGAGQGLFKTEDGGETWTEILPGQAGGVWLRFFDELEGVCINRDIMARTTDGGENWNPVSALNIPEFLEDEYTLILSGNNSLCAVGDRIYFGTNMGRIYRSKNRGATWEVLDPGFAATDVIYSVSFIDSLHGIAVAPQTLNSKIARTYDGGETWDVFSTPAFQAFFQNVAYVPGTDSTFVGVSTSGSTFGSFYSKDFGKTWEEIDSEIPYRAIGFANPQIGWVSRGFGGFGQPTMYKWDDDLFVSAREPEFEASISISPNPFDTELYIESPEAPLEGLALYSPSGSLIREVVLPGVSAYHWPLSGLPKGLFLLHIKTDKGLRCEKIVRP